MTTIDRIIKRAFDILLSLIGLILFGWIIFLAYVLALIDTKASGFFVQKRIGRNGKPFNVLKIRTMRIVPSYTTVVTTSHDPRITSLGRFFRKTKVDELPQLVNVLLGQMSFVGPRPDVPGFADKLVGKDRILLSIRPGITGPATLKYRNEEELLSRQNDPERYNMEVIFPDKVRINRDYIENYSFWNDVNYIWETVFR
jgi:lipopolysaccharide/colanic/teichoic acid biosynthesis glycosyltransferase